MMTGSGAEPGAVTGRRRDDLVTALVSIGALRSQAWQDAFAKVPRHVFVPGFFADQEHSGNFTLIDSESPADRDSWLSAVYSDEALITQLDGSYEAGAASLPRVTVGAVPTSSSTAPSLMATMLEALDISDGMKVLEIGTGTGYNAALLCERLGSGQVSSTDVDSVLVEAAGKRLRTLGYMPDLRAADGLAGYLENAPYDRILATVAVPAIPAEWITQSSQDGRILANIYRDLGGGALAMLTINSGRAEGRFLPQYGGFMPVRSCKAPSPLSLVQKARGTERQDRVTQVSGQVLDNPSFAFLAALLVPAQRLEVHPEDRPSEFWLVSRDGSWACQTADKRGGLIASQHGPRRIWDDLERAFKIWKSLREPARHTFGLTVTADGRHAVWHDQSAGPAWALPGI